MTDRNSEPEPDQSARDLLDGPDRSEYEDEFGGLDPVNREDVLGGPDRVEFEDEFGGPAPAGRGDALGGPDPEGWEDELRPARSSAAFASADVHDGEL
jgi:hypothetical protein